MTTPADLIPLNAAAGVANCCVATLRRAIRRGDLRHWRRKSPRGLGRLFVSEGEVRGLFTEVEGAVPIKVPAGVSSAAYEARQRRAIEELKRHMPGVG